MSSFWQLHINKYKEDAEREKKEAALNGGVVEKKTVAPTHMKPHEEEVVEYESDETPPPEKKRRKRVRLSRVPEKKQPPPPQQQQQQAAVPSTIQPASINTAPPAKKNLKRKQGPPDMDDMDAFRHCKQLLGIRDISEAYPLFDAPTKTAVNKAMKSMITGEFKQYLTQEEKADILSKKKDYEKVLAKKRNPFQGKRRHVGERLLSFVASNDPADSDSSDSDHGGCDKEKAAPIIDWTGW